ncbi:MAG: hypothetical protein AAB642_00940 [Patescibacteria group bacterium]
MIKKKVTIRGLDQLVPKRIGGVETEGNGMKNKTAAGTELMLADNGRRIKKLEMEMRKLKNALAM